MPPKPSQRRILPGFGLSLGFTLFYTSLIVLLPLAALIIKSLSLSWKDIHAILGQQQVQAAFWLTFTSSLLAAILNIPLGLLVAWVLVRYRFPGRRAMDALIDLPFALPTAIAGISLAFLYGPRGQIGKLLEGTSFTYPFPLWVGFDNSYFPLDLRWFQTVSLAPLGVVVALMFVGMPFVVRTIQPILEDLSTESEEAAASLGATRLQTFLRVILPHLYPALITGFALAFARGIGEYGSVLFITGNQPETLIVPHLIIQRIESYDIPGATVVAAALLLASFTILFSINILQWRLAKRGVR